MSSTICLPIKNGKHEKGHNTHKIIPIFSKVNQVIYSSAPISLLDIKAQAQILSEISCTQWVWWKNNEQTSKYKKSNKPTQHFQSWEHNKILSRITEGILMVTVCVSYKVLGSFKLVSGNMYPVTTKAHSLYLLFCMVDNNFHRQHFEYFLIFPRKQEFEIVLLKDNLLETSNLVMGLYIIYFYTAVAGYYGFTLDRLSVFLFPYDTWVNINEFSPMCIDIVEIWFGVAKSNGQI